MGMAFRLCDSAMCVAAAFALTVLSTGCVDNADSDNTIRDTAVYRAVIVDVVDRSGVDLDSSDELPTLFIEAFDADGIALEVQVEIVNDLTEQYDVRFVDDREEALAPDLADLPVRSNSLLIGAPERIARRRWISSSHHPVPAQSPPAADRCCD